MSVLAVVVTHNRRELLSQCLACLRRQEAPCDVLVVDNASTDGTGRFLAKAVDAGLFVLSLPENTGGAGGFNAGLRWGAERGYDFLWTLDDDTLPRPDALRLLLEAGQAVNGDFGFLASTALWTDGKPCRMNILHPLKKGQTEALMNRGVFRVDQATFVSCLFPAATVKKYGLSIRDFFIWGDDMEYTRRIAVRGKEPCYWAADSIVIHAMESNNGSAIATDGPERLLRYRYAYRNENYLYRQEGARGFLHYTARCAVHAGRVLLHAPNRRWKRISVIWGAYFSGLAFNPPVERLENIR